MVSCEHPSNEEFGLLDKTRQKADFLAYFEKMTHKKDDKWTCVYKHFFKFVQGHCTFGDVTVELCKKFREYLLNANQLNRTKQKVSLNSAAGYYSTFRGLLKIAYRDKWLRENINDYLDKIEPQDVKNILVLRNAFEKTRKQMKANALSINALSDNLNFPMFAELTLKKT